MYNFHLSIGTATDGTSVRRSTNFRCYTLSALDDRADLASAAAERDSHCTNIFIPL